MAGYVKEVTPRRVRRGLEQRRTMRKNLGILLVTSGFVAFLGFSACTVAVKDDTTGSGGGTSTGTSSSGAAGSSAGAGGTSSTAGSAGMGQAGQPITDSGTGITLPETSLPVYKEAGWDAYDGGCINDPTDAGDMANPDLCSTLNMPTNSSTCYQGSDAVALCSLMHDNARRGAFQVFFDCIKAQTKTDPCAPIDSCVDPDHWPTGCQVGKVVVSNGKSWDCTNLVAKCPADDAGNGFTLAQCDFIMNVFTDEARTKIFDCYLVKNNDPSTCVDDFTSCVYNPDQ
jgi:hypothetical protein